MIRLSLRLLGGFQAVLDGDAATGFESDKARALLAFLVVEAHRPHRREEVAGLFWPERPERAARTNLRRVLYNLRSVLGDRRAPAPFLLVTRQTVQFNQGSEYWLDVAAFVSNIDAAEERLSSPEILEKATTLYQGEFLKGISVAGCVEFEEWVVVWRERLHHKLFAALGRLVTWYDQHGDYESALQVGRRQLALEPWNEQGHRNIMRLLVYTGQKGAALAQFDKMRRILDEELSVMPGPETTRLYEQIRDGTLPPPPRPPLFLVAPPPDIGRPLFVARSDELSALKQGLTRMRSGQTQMRFIKGSAGSGKTALVEEFARVAEEMVSDLLIVKSKGNAYTGTGDPYLPFRGLLGQLTGDFEALWAAGSISQDQAYRLWGTLPVAVRALNSVGRDLIGTLVPADPLVARARACAPGGAPWIEQLIEIATERKGEGPSAPIQQPYLFEQVALVLQAVAKRAPLLIILDDQQWLDTGSASLLFYLGRQLATDRIMIVGIYRPEALVQGQAGKRHPLEPIVNELDAQLGQLHIDLENSDRQQFINALIDSEPNSLETPFRDTLFRHTQGHALFTVELLRGMKKRGELCQDNTGKWVVGPSLEWGALPARVDAVIAARLGSVPPTLRQVLNVAAVEGEEFTAEIVAQVLGMKATKMIVTLSEQLDRTYHLLSAQDVAYSGEQRFSHYRFRHQLFQRHLYQHLDPAERSYLHQAVGEALEDLLSGSTEPYSPQLARHFSEAGQIVKAARYLQEAGERAVRLSANQEAIDHFEQALAALETLPDSDKRKRQELAVRSALYAPLVASKGYAAVEVARNNLRAYELCQALEKDPRLLPTLWQLGSYFYARGELLKGLVLVEQMIPLAEQTQDPLQLTLAYWAKGSSQLNIGKLASSRRNLELALGHYRPENHKRLAQMAGQDPGVSSLSWSAWGCWMLGYPELAQKRSQEALALSAVLDHPFTTTFANSIAGSLFHQMCRNVEAAAASSQTVMALATEYEFPLFQVCGSIISAWAHLVRESGKAQQGVLEQMEAGVVTWQEMQVGMQLPHLMALLAQAFGLQGQPQKGLATAERALEIALENDELYYQAELLRVRGELLLMEGASEDAAASFQKAIDVARTQQAKAWELRATTSLARLWRDEGRESDARRALQEIYSWFEEGFDTPDLAEVKELLSELS